MNIGCMQSGCPTEFSDGEVRACVSQAVFNKYMRFVKNAMVDLDPNKRWCPNKSCAGYIQRVNSQQSDVVCHDCGTLVCFSCGETSHEGRKCGESPVDEDFDQWKR